jgi:hypothetical protein
VEVGRWSLSHSLLTPDHTSPGSRQTTRMSLAPPPGIHKALLIELLQMVFEYHAELEWRAPAIDGRVCRLWRRVVLRVPRAWAYLEICKKKPPSLSDLRSWLERSRDKHLHICADKNFSWSTRDGTLYSLLRDHHTRIASLRMGQGELSFFERCDFPTMRLLEVHRWSLRNSFTRPFRWGSIPKLQSLRLGSTRAFLVPLDSLPPLKTLTLYFVKYTALSRNSESLVTLMLHKFPFAHPPWSIRCARLETPYQRPTPCYLP